MASKQIEIETGVRHYEVERGAYKWIAPHYPMYLVQERCNSGLWLVRSSHRRPETATAELDRAISYSARYRDPSDWRVITIWTT